MTKEVYDSLTAGEKFVYNELAGFAKRLSGQQGEIIDLLKKIISEAEA